MKRNLDSHGVGMLAALGAYILWGILPLYWKLISHIPAEEVLAHRVIWSLVLMFIILLVLKKLQAFWEEVRLILSNKKQLLFMLLASVFISLNWFTYIWSVSNDRLVETSLGYYINPIVSVVLGMLFFKEKLTRWQSISFILAIIGVVIMTVSTGGLPIVSLTLAFSFAFYGAIKKMVNVGALTGLAIETMLVTPIAILYLTFIHSSVNHAIYVHAPGSLVLLVGAGAATAIPLLLFAIGARRVPLATIGFLQYLAPTITLFIGVVLYNEPFSQTHLIAFAFIWTALAIYSLSKTSILKKLPYARKRTAS